jgi:predicted amidohydrolase
VGELADDAESAGSWWALARGLAARWYGRADRTVDPREHDAWIGIGVVASGLVHGSVTDAAPALAEIETTFEWVETEIIAHAVCDAVCRHWGQAFTEDWVAEQNDELRPAQGEPIPVVWRNRDTATRKLSSYPPRLTADLDLFEYVRPAKATVEIRGRTVGMVFDFTLADELAPIDESVHPVSAAMHLNQTHDELSKAPEGAADYFGVRPLDPVEQARLAAEAHALAIGAGCTLLVGTECADCDEVTTAILKLQATSDSAGPVVVTGSRHDTGEKANIARIVASGRVVEAHRKIVPFGYPGGFPHKDEGIIAGDEIRVFVSGRTRLAVLICRDFLESSICDLLVANGVNLVCVPALTPVMQPFADRARSVSGDTQGTVIVANSPREEERGAAPSTVDPPAAIALPYAAGNAPVPDPPPGLERGVTLVGSDGTVEWGVL